RTNTFQYVANRRWQIQEIDDPFGRKAQVSYNPFTWWPTNIIDAAGMTNSFSYQSGSIGWLASYTTPYGTTTFDYYQRKESGTDPDEFSIRALLVKEPAGARQFFYYLHNNDG